MISIVILFSQPRIKLHHPLYISHSFSRRVSWCSSWSVARDAQLLSTDQRWLRRCPLTDLIDFPPRTIVTVCLTTATARVCLARHASTWWRFSRIVSGKQSQQLSLKEWHSYWFPWVLRVGRITSPYRRQQRTHLAFVRRLGSMMRSYLTSSWEHHHLLALKHKYYPS